MLHVRSQDDDGGNMRFRTQLTRFVLLAALSVVETFAQTASLGRPAFEAASIKPSETSMIQAITSGSLVGLEIKPGRVRAGHMTLGNLILAAYAIKNYQLQGPDWLLAVTKGALPAMFDLEAKLPDGASVDQVPLMLQSLLADRFKLEIRKGSKDIDTYALVAQKSGARLQRRDPVTVGDSPASAVDRRAEKETTGNRTTVVGNARITFETGGGVHLSTSTVSGIIDLLSVQLTAFPVVDKTGIAGSFDINIDLPPGEPIAPRAGTPANPAEMDSRKLDLWSAPLEKLGLRIELEKNPIETIIVERVEKIPTDN
jgi:uncharacterized protein (TIGR03435 family)